MRKFLTGVVVCVCIGILAHLAGASKKPRSRTVVRAEARASATPINAGFRRNTNRSTPTPTPTPVPSPTATPQAEPSTVDKALAAVKNGAASVGNMFSSNDTKPAPTPTPKPGATTPSLTGMCAREKGGAGGIQFPDAKGNCPPGSKLVTSDTKVSASRERHSSPPAPLREISDQQNEDPKTAFLRPAQGWHAGGKIGQQRMEAALDYLGKDFNASWASIQELKTVILLGESAFQEGVRNGQGSSALGVMQILGEHEGLNGFSRNNEWGRFCLGLLLYADRKGPEPLADWNDSKHFWGTTVQRLRDQLGGTPSRKGIKKWTCEELKAADRNLKPLLTCVPVRKLIR